MDVKATVAAYKALPNDQKDQFHADTNTRSLADPSKKVNDAVWLIVVSTLAFVLVGTIGALALMSYLGKSTEVIGPIVTFILGIFGGLLAPSPIAGQGGGGK